MKQILVINTGCSTIKFKLFALGENKSLEIIKKGKVERIGQPNGPVNYKSALSMLFHGLEIGPTFLLKIPNLIAIGHRVVHSGDKYSKTTLLNKDIVNDLKSYNLLAPLHNPAIIEVIESIIKASSEKKHREVPNYAVFDTAFFKNLPDIAKIYPLPYRFYKEEKIRKFGFHGISHQYAYEQVKQKYGNPEKVIIIHLGAGSSMTAIKNGEPVDTSMGFTPLEGLMMTTRPGDFDAGVIHYLISQKILKHEEIDSVLNNESGLLGISGTRSDVKDLLYLAGYPIDDPIYRFKPYHNAEVSPENRKRAQLALAMYVYKIKKYLGSYNAILGGTDVLAFTGAIGSGSEFLRQAILSGLDHILVGTKIEVIVSDEELQIAKEIIKIIR